MPFSLRTAGLSGALSAAALAITLIAGCSDPSSEGGSEPANPSSTQPSSEEGAADATTPEQAAASETTGGDGSAITLNALTEQDMRQAELPGELGCQFTTEDGQVLLIAMGNVASSEPARGVVKVAGYVEPVSAPGGFDGITDSPTFNGKGKTVQVQVTGKPTEGGESPPRPATLTYDRADGAQRTWPGQWRCGP
ncbi:hypothetical protein [Alloalcanivorax gelatiniphagus]|uniref:Uncharacterized protein n=1 Tax=Alloalcanivorax gelatiniphagus TaxID=1194167 RepID=A0ABY2XJZ9_9GAMM|nr:hypothetical protein [Alloalcanivorax gelatiniphagus]TMW11938.1 hypothetical protein FGS76_13000 [Alloalcanivorax gelatiniphagus]